MGDGGRPEVGRGALPRQLTRFFGRDRETDELVDLLDGERLVTLVGAPGCGKTRLAITVATELQPRFPGGVRFVELATITDPASIPNAVAVALDIPEAPGRPRDEVLLAVLQEAPALLVVLDNCEHLVEPVATLAHRIVDACPSVSVLATSRTGLGVAGELVFRVPPLDVVSARQLFVDRAVALSADVPFESGDRPVVEAICLGLDCVPLAVELTAAWSRALSPSQILERLSQALPEHSRAGRGREPRHLTMAEAIEWSYRRLPADAQTLFRQVSVFVGGFDLDAAEAVAAGLPDVLANLRVLLDESLVLSERVGGGPMRYRVLEPVRQHAAALLASSDEEAATRGRHVDFYLAMAQGYDPWGMRGQVSTVSSAQLQQDDGNLHAAFDWARRQPSDIGLRFGEAMASYWAFGGRITDGLRWLDDVLAAGSADRRLVAIAMIRAGLLEWRKGDYDDALSRLEVALDLGDVLEDELVRAHALTIMGTAEFSAGRIEEAMQHCREAVAIFEAHQDQYGSIGALVSLGWAQHARDDVARGNAAFQALLDAHSDTWNPTAIAYGHFGLAYGAMLQRNTRAQREHLNATLVAMNEGGVVERADWLWFSICLAGAERRAPAAYRLLGGADTLAQRRGGSQYPQQLGLSPGLFAELFEPCRRDVSPPERERLTEEGRSLSWDELTAEALAEPTIRRSPLTVREREIAEHVAAGLTNVDIARKLGISRRTVESHLDHIKQKLGLASRNEVIIWMHGGLP